MGMPPTNLEAARATATTARQVALERAKEAEEAKAAAETATEAAEAASLRRGRDRGGDLGSGWLCRCRFWR